MIRLLLKLPQDMRAEFKRYLYPQRIPTLLHFAKWLEYELKMQETVFETLSGSGKADGDTKKERRRDLKSNLPTSILHGADQPGSTAVSETPPTQPSVIQVIDKHIAHTAPMISTTSISAPTSVS